MSTPPRQLRLIIETADFAEAHHFFSEVLGLPEQPAFATDGEDRVAILQAGVATIEIATPAHVEEIDRLEGAEHVPGSLRIALEVEHTRAMIGRTERAGLPTLAAPTTTPFQTINARVQGPAGWQITFFQELEPLERRATRPGFHTEADRP